MAALTETGGIALVTAILSSAAIVMVAWIGRRATAGRAEAKVRQEAIVQAVQPANGYANLGQAVEAIQTELRVVSDRLAEGDARFHRIEHRAGRLEDQVGESLALTADTRAMLRRYVENDDRGNG